MDKFIAYYRKSTDKEDKQILSLDGQQEVVQDYAARNNITIIKEIRESYSAKKPGRPKFNKEVIKPLSEGKADGVIAYKADRLTRNYVDLGALSGLLENGVTIIDTVYGEYKNDSNGKFMLGINTCIAKRKIDDLSEDTLRGLKQKAEQGWYPCRAPAGYKNNKLEHTIEVDPKKSPYIKRAFQLYATGNYTLKSLGKKLYKEGLRTGKNPSHTIPESTLEKILKNPFYYGDFKYSGKLYEGKHKALITKNLWDKVQKELRRTYKNDSEESNKHHFRYRLKGLRCGECGCAITAEKQKGHIYYRCTKSKGNCSQPYIREENLEKQLIDIFENVRLSQKHTEQVMDKIREMHKEDIAYQEKVERKVKTQLTKLKEEKKKLTRKMVNDKITEEEFNELKMDINNEIKKTERKLSNLRHRTKDWFEQSSKLLKLSRRAPELFLEGNKQQKQILLNMVSSNVVLKDRKVLVDYKKPFDRIAETASCPSVGG